MISSSPEPQKIEHFAEILTRLSGKRVNKTDLWAAFAEAFPVRPYGPEEVHWFLDALRALEERGVIRLPPITGRRWEEAQGVRIPSSVDLNRKQPEKTAPDWREYPWHPRLSWIPDLKRLTDVQREFLLKVHQGLVEGWFSEPAPFKYRSLQLTGDEKGIRYQLKSALFGPGKLDLELLGCMKEVLPLAWEAVSDRPRAIVFENADPFTIARRVLTEMADPPYGIVVYGEGGAFCSSAAYLATLGRPVSEIHYVGDMDKTGMEIALVAREAARKAGLPELKPATVLHREMLRSAAALGNPRGWPGPKARSFHPLLFQKLTEYLGEEIGSGVIGLLKEGRRIPEEVLGTEEMRRGMAASDQSL